MNFCGLETFSSALTSPSPKHSFSGPPRMLSLTLQMEATFLPIFPPTFPPHPATYFSCPPEIVHMRSLYCMCLVNLLPEINLRAAPLESQLKVRFASSLLSLLSISQWQLACKCSLGRWPGGCDKQVPSHHLLSMFCISQTHLENFLKIQ